MTYCWGVGEVYLLVNHLCVIFAHLVLFLALAIRVYFALYCIYKYLIAFQWIIYMGCILLRWPLTPMGLVFLFIVLSGSNYENAHKKSINCDIWVMNLFLLNLLVPGGGHGSSCNREEVKYDGLAVDIIRCSSNRAFRCQCMKKFQPMPYKPNNW